MGKDRIGSGISTPLFEDAEGIEGTWTEEDRRGGGCGSPVPPIVARTVPDHPRPRRSYSFLVEDRRSGTERIDPRSDDARDSIDVRRGESRKGGYDRPPGSHRFPFPSRILLESNTIPLQGWSPFDPGLDPSGSPREGPTWSMPSSFLPSPGSLATVQSGTTIECLVSHGPHLEVSIHSSPPKRIRS